MASAWHTCDAGGNQNHHESHEAGMLTPAALSFAATYAFFAAAPSSSSSAYSNHGTHTTDRQEGH